MFLYNKENNLVSVSNSILKHFTGKTLNQSHLELYQILSKKEYKKVVVMLFDGFGKSIRQTHLSKTDFLRKKEAFEITSVFPPTTVAATTSFLSARYPNETGWLGWQQYFKQHDRVVEMFTNIDADKKEKLPPPFLSNLYCPYTSILDLINDTTNTKAYSLYPKRIDPNGAENLDEFFSKVSHMMKQDSSHFIYTYWTDPDTSIHQYGVHHPIVKNVVKRINQKIYQLAKDNPDNLIILLADHSLVDTKFFYVFEHEDFASCLSSIVSLDSRSSFFHVKYDKKEEFKTLFDKYYGKYFVLKTKQEVIDEKWFGNGKTNHPLFEYFLGDFLATSISEYGFTNSKEETLIGAHAGSLEEESIISVSIINK